jgi:FHS family L-fucose permease-like MFS transporter
MGPYLGLGLLLLAIGIVIATQKAPKIIEEFPDVGDTSMGALVRMLWNNKRYRFGVVAQFFNVAAQVCTRTYLLQYVQQTMNGSLELGGYLLQISLIVFLLSRFLMT